VLRLPPALHAQLKKSALAAGKSLNAVCVERLQSYRRPESGTDGDAAQLVAELEGVLGHDAVEGIVLFGSVARERPSGASDADLLIVLTEGQKLHRGLYTMWDSLKAANHLWYGYPASPQFVLLPRAASAPTGLWYEVALDGIVLWDRHGEIRAVLRRLRLEMSHGIIQRRETHGHPYWVRKDGYEKSVPE
jgi:predicted nucleotidyltransferase